MDFFSYSLVVKLWFVFEKTKINEKEARVGPFKKSNSPKFQLFLNLQEAAARGSCKVISSFRYFENCLNFIQAREYFEIESIFFPGRDLLPSFASFYLLRPNMEKRKRGRLELQEYWISMKYRFTFSDANRPVSSVTRFGKVPPFWQNFKTLKHCFEGLVNCWAKFWTHFGKAFTLLLGKFTSF